ncbi:hypothetical protein BDR22DRAFT_969148 [Usnea florida]
MFSLSIAALGLTFFSINTAAVPLALPDAMASLISNLPADHVAGLASLMARGYHDLHSFALHEERGEPQSSPVPSSSVPSISIPSNTILSNVIPSSSIPSNSLQNNSMPNNSMSAIIDSYIINLKQAGFVPNANATISKRDTLSHDSLLGKRDVPSVPLIINLLKQHGFVPVNGTNSKRDISDFESALQNHTTTMPDVNLVISRLAAHGFVPSVNGSQALSGIAKRSNVSDIDAVITQLEIFGFDPSAYMQQANSSTLLSGNSSASAQEIAVAQ